MKKPTPFRYRLVMPTANEYPFDKAANKLCMLFKLHNWDIPGYTIEWWYDSTGETKTAMPHCIKGPDLYICFYRWHRRKRNRDPKSGAGEIRLDGKIIKLYNDHSSVNYYVYDGDDYKTDKQYFIGDSNLHTPETNTKHYRTGNSRKWRTNILIDDTVHWNTPLTEENSMRCADAMNDIAQSLENLVAKLEKLPRPELDPRSYLKIDVTPLEQWPFGNLRFWAHIRYRERERLEKLRNDPESLTPEERYGVSTKRSGEQLQSFYIKWNPEWHDPDMRYVWHKMTWCFPADDPKAYIENTPDGDLFWGYDSTQVEIRPKYANAIFVADEDVYWEKRREFEEALPVGTVWDTFQLTKARDAFEASIVPITEYHGQYKHPILLIGRELDMDEVVL